MSEKSNLARREYRKKTGNISTKKYEKTKRGFLVRCYRNMKSRVTGVQYKKAHLYYGKELLDKESFYNFSLSDYTFNIIFDEWEKSNYNKKLSPSIDRIKSDKGYTLDNIQWLTKYENSMKGLCSRNSKEYQLSMILD